MEHSISDCHKQFRKCLELNILEEIYTRKHIWEPDDLLLGGRV